MTRGRRPLGCPCLGTGARFRPCTTTGRCPRRTSTFQCLQTLGMATRPPRTASSQRLAAKRNHMTSQKPDHPNHEPPAFCETRRFIVHSRAPEDDVSGAGVRRRNGLSPEQVEKVFLPNLAFRSLLFLAMIARACVVCFGAILNYWALPERDPVAPLNQAPANTNDSRQGRTQLLQKSPENPGCCQTWN